MGRSKPSTATPRRRVVAVPHETIGAALLRRRHELGLSQVALAEKSRVSVTTISTVENDHVLPRRATLVLLCGALGLTLAELAKLDGYLP